LVSFVSHLQAGTFLITPYTTNMVSFTSFLPLLAILLTTSSAVPLLEERAATTCGSTYYTADQVNAAAQKACSYYKAGSAPGGYPHTYNNYEGFSFPVAGPYQEFPLLASHALYTGSKFEPQNGWQINQSNLMLGSPGADRVIINTACKLAGAITHTGASGNNFVGCSGTS
jgi:hypothetical protein